MNVSMVLLIILFALMTIIGGKRGLKSFFTLITNFIILLIMFILIINKVDPIKVTIFACIIISCITLFYINGVNVKTVAALISIIMAVLLAMIITYKIGVDAKIQGIGEDQAEIVLNYFNKDNLDFSKIFICQVLIGLIGAIIDVSISISSSMYELYKSDLSMTKQSILISGMNIGKDILGTMTNTLLFAYISGFMVLALYFNKIHYSITEIANTRVFCSDIFQILCSGIGIVLIIPITAFITSRLLFFDFKFSKLIKKRDCD